MSLQERLATLRNKGCRTRRVGDRKGLSEIEGSIVSFRRVVMEAVAVSHPCSLSRMATTPLFSPLLSPDPLSPRSSLRRVTSTSCLRSITNELAHLIMSTPCSHTNHHPTQILIGNMNQSRSRSRSRQPSLTRSSTSGPNAQGAGGGLHLNHLLHHGGNKGSPGSPAKNGHDGELSKTTTRSSSTYVVSSVFALPCRVSCGDRSRRC